MAKQPDRTVQLMAIIGGSLLLVVGITVGLFFLFKAASRDPVDVRTAASDARVLARIDWPGTLPAVFVPEQPDADASEAYRKVFAYVDGHQRELKKPEAAPTESAELAELLIIAMNAGRVTRGFLDEQTPLLPWAEPTFGLAMQKTTEVVSLYAADLLNKKESTRALAAGKAVWALGQRAFMDNLRFTVRATGLEIMDAGSALIQECDPQSPVTQWQPYIRNTREAWTKKGATVFALEPNVADVIAIAQLDKDPTWRFESTLKLGSLKFFWGSKKGNKALIDQALARAKEDADPQIAQAGAAALAITREQHLKQQ